MLLKANPASLPLGPFACHDPPRLDLSVEGGWGAPTYLGWPRLLILPPLRATPHKLCLCIAVFALTS